MKMQSSFTVNQLMYILEQAGHEVWMVGGCVRDMLLQRRCHDIDLTTSAAPAQMKALFLKQGCHIIETGIRHGTLGILCDTGVVEITTYRKEGAYLFHRTPSSVSFTNRIEDDLARRDFTINAIAWHPQRGLKDPYHGKDDLQSRRIRCVGDPYLRLKEDALRILRALRFSAVLHFTIEPSTLSAIKQHSNLLRFISHERIRKEFDQILLSAQTQTLSCLKECGVLDIILCTKQLQQEHALSFDSSKLALLDDMLEQMRIRSIEEALAILLRFFLKKDHIRCREEENAVRKLLRCMTYEKRIVQKVCALLQVQKELAPKRAVLRRTLACFHNQFDDVKMLIDLQRCAAIASHRSPRQLDQALSLLNVMEEEQDILSYKDLAVNGEDLRQLGAQGKQISTLLELLFAHALAVPQDNHREYLLRMAEKELQKLTACRK